MPRLSKQPLTLQTITNLHEHTAVERRGIGIPQAGDDFIRTPGPVGTSPWQLAGILHGEASVVPAEQSAAGAQRLRQATAPPALDSNANPLRRAGAGRVLGTALRVRVGGTTQARPIGLQDGPWHCCARIRVAVLAPRGNA